MKAKPFSLAATETYINENLENSCVISYKSPLLKEAKRYFYEDLEDIEINAYPFASDLCDKEGHACGYEEYDSLPEEEKAKYRLRYSYLPNYHELYVGTTGSGKTTGCIEPQLRALAKQKNKPNLFVTDPKGELFSHNARFLKEEGYNIFVLNFKDFSKTDRWNPLLEIYEAAQEVRKVGEGARYETGEIPADLEKIPANGDFSKGFFVYKNKAFANADEINRFLSVENYLAVSKVSTLANQFASSALPTKSQKDPTWEEGARGLLFGIIMALAEDAIDPAKGMTADKFTLKTVYDTFTMLRESVLEGTPRSVKEKAARFMQGKTKLVQDKISAVLNTADGTRKGYFSTFDSRLVSWFQGHIYILTSGTTVDITSDEHPFAIFIATRDYEKSDFLIAGTFIDWVYRQTLIKAENAPKDANNNPLTRDVHFLLDEFGNIPEIPNFENKIATARSRKIWFHLIVQSYEQIELVYGKETAPVIIDNCNQQTFLGSQSRETKEKFSKECGKRTVVALESRLADSDRKTHSLSEVAVVPISHLDLINPGQYYAKRIYTPVIKGQYIRSYRAASLGEFPNFDDPFAVRDIAPNNFVVPDDKNHTYENVTEVGKMFVSKIKEPQEESKTVMPEEPTKWNADEFLRRFNANKK